MKYLFAIGCFVLSSGCATPPAQHTPSVQVEAGAIELPEQPLDMADAGKFESVVLSHSVMMESLMPEPLIARCGVIPQEQGAQEWLADAHDAVTYRFTGISESWIPINGEPTRYQIYSVR